MLYAHSRKSGYPVVIRKDTKQFCVVTAPPVPTMFQFSPVIFADLSLKSMKAVSTLSATTTGQERNSEPAKARKYLGGAGLQGSFPLFLKKLKCCSICSGLSKATLSISDPRSLQSIPGPASRGFPAHRWIPRLLLSIPATCQEAVPVAGKT